MEKAMSVEEDFLSKILAVLAETPPENDDYFLSRLRSIANGERDQPDVDLPDPVRPSSMERVKKVRAVIRRKFRLETPRASEMTAAFYGFYSYRELREAHFAPAGSVGLNLEDEECPPATVIHRREIQATILVKLAGADAPLAKRVIQLVRPTARDWNPSLMALSPFRRVRAQ
jgi:hypothetical protein